MHSVFCYLLCACLPAYLPGGIVEAIWGKKWFYQTLACFSGLAIPVHKGMNLSYSEPWMGWGSGLSVELNSLSLPIVVSVCNCQLLLPAEPLVYEN